MTKTRIDIAASLIEAFKNPSFNKEKAVQRAITWAKENNSFTFYLSSIESKSPEARFMQEVFNREPEGFDIRLVFGFKDPASHILHKDTYAPQAYA